MLSTFHWRAAAFLLACLLYGAACAQRPAAAAGDAARGMRLYLDGVRADGTALHAFGANGIQRNGRDAACVACHRRSGFGSAEGPFGVRPITSQDVFQDRPPVAATARIAHQLGKPARPPYDSASLAAALREGIDSAGSPLGALMPRYTLSAGELRDLEAYLRTLGAQPAEGVDGEDIHLATVIQPGVAPARRGALLAVLDAFVRDKNAAVRSEPARRRAGAMRMQRAYRRWVLHVWDLSGPASAWPGQLDALYRAQPVFALVSGLGDDDWAPIHRFSERRRLPGILPLARLPAVMEPNFYTLYFSTGILLEAQELGRHLAAGGGRVTQVYRTDDAAACAAAATLRRSLAGSAVVLADRPLRFGPDSDTRAGTVGDAAVVAWLGSDDLARLGAPAAPAYVAQSLVPQASPPGWERAQRVSRWEADAPRALRLRRVRDWLTARSILPGEEEVQVNAWFAMSMLGEALMHMMDSFSREYLLEQVEHNINVTILPSMYPHLSVGRDMRIAAHEIYLGQASSPLGLSDPTDVSAPERTSRDTDKEQP